ncbi:uncharacterized protein LOC132271824 [Cornus florida]|uniref:uncharacterized protein LOC132271824 n=1 Tax=Cornus florida TaxID=4283 RepID=UPI00289BFAC2|nr:uncharacterized protein LOC132271824 [Cornus florida]
MPMDTNKANDQSGLWTNERHLKFLNSMEASFVRTMFENNGRPLRLDRYMPDSSESTLDLKKERPRRHSTSDIRESRARTDKKSRKRASQPYTSDQVVPQLGKIGVAKEERDHHDIKVEPTT